MWQSNRLQRQTRRIAHRSTPFVVLLSLFLFGCGDGGDMPTGRVSGTVTYKGKQVTGGSLTFIPVPGGGAEGGKPAAGEVQADGTYRLGTYGTTDGAVVGRHRVLYSAPAVEIPEGKTFKPGEAVPASPYAGLAPKQTEVEVKSGSNTIDIDLAPLGKKK